LADPKSGEIVKTNPDPTEAVKEALTLAIKNLDDKFAARFAANDAAVLLARQELKDQLIALDSNIAGKFLSNKDLVDQLGEANAAALGAALLTQKEIANKSETATADSLRQLQTSFETANKATNEKIDRLTSRLDTGEGRVHATDDSKHDRTTDKGQTLVIIIATTGIVSLLFGIAMAIIPRAH
jgi:hypothetical protein